MTAEATLTPTTAAGQELLELAYYGEGSEYVRLILAIEREAATAAVRRLQKAVLNEVNEARGFLVQRVDDWYVEQARIHLDHAARFLQDPDPRLTEQESRP